MDNVIYGCWLFTVRPSCCLYDGSVSRKKKSQNSSIQESNLNRFGRKRTLVIGVIPLIVAWSLFATATSVWQLYLARILSGFTFGLSYCVVPMYLSEIASTRIRGSLITMITVMNKLGVLLVYCIGPFVSFTWLAYTCLIPPTVFILCCRWLPESPYWLLSKKRHNEAFSSLAMLRGHSNVQAELDQMLVAVDKSLINRGTIRELFGTKGNRRALAIVIGLTIIQILCGSQAIIGYSQTIFHRVNPQLQASHVSIMFGSVQLVAAASAASVVDWIGRRPLLLVSVLGTAVCNAVVATYFLMDRLNVTIDVRWSAVPIVAIMAFIVFYVIGMASVIYTILGEIFPNNLRAVAGAIYTITCSVCSFSVYKLFQVVSDGWGSDISFYIFAFFGLCFLPFVYYVVPETKRKSLEEILRELNM